VQNDCAAKRQLQVPREVVEPMPQVQLPVA
jgi:hypothetical protein